MGKNKWVTVLAFTIVFIIPLILFAYWFTRERPTVGVLPMYGAFEVLESTDSTGGSARDTVYHRAADFRLIDHMGDTMSTDSLAGKVTVVHFMQRTDPEAVMVMENLRHLQEEFLLEDRVFLLTHIVGSDTADLVTPVYDFARKNGVNHHRWLLLTGTDSVLYALARNEYLLPETGREGRTPTDLVLVDKERRIRGFYPADSEASRDQLRIDIKRLLISYIGPHTTHP